MVAGGHAAIPNPFAVWAAAESAALVEAPAEAARAITEETARQTQEASAKDLFHAMDADASGSLDLADLKMLLSRLAKGQKLTKKKIEKAFEDMDSGGSGEVDWAEFSEWYDGLEDESRATIDGDHMMS